jgi:hypothetical protein
MVQALLAHETPDWDPAEGLRDQAIQVSNISLFNFCGRITIGLFSIRDKISLRSNGFSGVVADIIKHRFGYPRTFAMILVATGFIISQLVASQIEDIGHLWKASMVLGGSYGMLFGLFPTLVIEWFGLGEHGIHRFLVKENVLTSRLTAHFSENWGFVSIAPAFGGCAR